jgi:hypothetical protein
MTVVRRVRVEGQSYLAPEPLTFAAMRELNVKKCTEAYKDVSFRVVLEP